MKNLMNFENKEFGNVRAINLDSKIWFVGIDAAKMLGYKRPDQAILDNIPDKHRKILNQSNTGLEGLPNRGLTVVSQAGFLRLVLRSKLPQAEKIVDWITEEVIPSIMKTGSYSIFDSHKFALKVDSRPTSEYRQKKIENEFKNGKPEYEIEVRVFNVKLQLETQNIINSLGFPGSKQKVARIIFKGVTGVEPAEYRFMHEIKNKNITREYCPHPENQGLQHAETAFCEYCLNYNGKINREQMYKFAHEAAKRGEEYMRSRMKSLTFGSNIKKSSQATLSEYIDIFNVEKCELTHSMIGK